MAKHGNKRKKSGGSSLLLAALLLVLVGVGALLGVAVGRGMVPGRGQLSSLAELFSWTEKEEETIVASDGDILILPASSSPKEQFEIYVELLNKQDYESMYSMLSNESRASITEDAFVERNSGIYKGISASDITIEWPEDGAETSDDGLTVTYTMTMNTCAGELSFDNTVSFVSEDGSYRLSWNDAVIFPDLEATDKVRVMSTLGHRGNIYDRNGKPLAVNTAAVSVGLVPGEMESDSEQRLADALDITTDTIEQKLKQSWVNDGSFVPIQTVEGMYQDGSTVVETDNSSEESSSSTEESSSASEEESSYSDAELAEIKELLEEISEIPGVMLKDTTVRTYPMGEAAAHVVGYVQNISSDELENDTEGVYTTGSQIGKSGAEKAYEEQLRGVTGRKMVIVAENGDTKKVLATSESGGGQDVTLTIDSELQQLIYDTYSEVDSGTVAMNPYTGEILALVSTPSYDTNLFSQGLSTEQWDEWTNDEDKPLLSRFQETWTPGSSMKTLTALIGITSGLLDPDENLESSESWQKDESWGEYSVTTLHVAKPANLMNALVLSDNVYFAKAAVQIGADEMEKGWTAAGFGESVPIPLTTTASSYSNTEHLSTEVQLADSGYGQGQMQVNPIHMAAMYSAVLNEGSMVQPTLTPVTYPTYWKRNVFSAEACETVAEALRNVVLRSSGTGYAACMKYLPLAGKTGTAELKATLEETDGGELGWFTSFTVDKEQEDSLLICSMVENAQNLGGSGYVVRKSRDIYVDWYKIVKERKREQAAAERESEQASLAESREESKAARESSIEASKAERESSIEASKALREASLEASESARESSIAASSAAKELSKKASEASRASSEAAAESSREAERSLEDQHE